MSLLDLLDDYLFGPMNLINRLEGGIKLLIATDRGSRFAILRQDKGGKHSLREVRELLRRYHIDTFGCTHDAQHFYFTVKLRQASWAEYILLRAGIETCSGTINPRNHHYVAKHSPGSLPMPWDEKKAEAQADLSSLSQPQTHTTKQVNSLSSQFTQLIESLFD